MNDEGNGGADSRQPHLWKAHGAGDPALLGPEPEGAGIEEQGFGWISKRSSGNGAHTITGGPKQRPKRLPKWSNNFFENPFGYEWESPKPAEPNNG